jgi:NlpC/P60 family putative phage cell wall peptidase
MTSDERQQAALADAIVAAARGWIGTPYLHQASVRGVGCDCLGLVRGVWREIVGDEPETPGPYTPDWAEAGGRETLLDAANRYFQPVSAGLPFAGAVLLFRWRDGLPVKHTGIATGPTSMVHAHDGAKVAEVAIGPWWQRHIAQVLRFPLAPR